MRHRSRPLRLLVAAAAAAIATTVITPIQPALAAEGDAANAAVTETLVAAGDIWSYHDNGTNPGNNWNQPDYNDNTWQTGNAQFGYGDGDETTIINYGPDPQNKYATTHFRKTINLTNTHQLANTTAQLTYDDGAIIYLNGTQIHHSGNIPDNHTHQTWANQNREETITLTIDPTLFTNGQNTIAVEIHQAWRKSNDISFDLQIEAQRNDDPAPPVVNDDYAVTEEGSPVWGELSDNDDPNLTYQFDVALDPLVGIFQEDPTGGWILTPAPSFVGTVVIPHTGCNPAGLCVSAELIIEVELRGDVSIETLVAAGDIWSYHDNGTNPGNNWNQPDYNDNTWQTGNAQFGYGDGDETTIINYGPDPQNKYATTHFRKTINLTNTHQLANTTAQLTYDDGAIIYLNGTQIHHSGNIPDNHTHQTWANQNREETITLTIDPTLFTNGQNTIAVEIHQAWRKSNDISFDLQIEATRQILPGPPAPTALDDRAATPPGRSVSGSVADNDRANDDGSLVWTVYPERTPDPATVGLFAMTASGSYQFTPVDGYAGPVTVQYEVCNQNACAHSVLTIIVIDGEPAAPGLADLTNPGPQAALAGQDVLIDLAAAGPNTQLTVDGLPGGLTVDQGGVITGQVAAGGTYPITAYLISAEDQSYDYAQFDLVIDAGSLVTRDLGLAGPVHIANPGPIDLTVGEPIDLALEFQVTNGTFSYQWLVDGLTGTIDGRLTGAPTGAGSSTARIKLVDLDGNESEILVLITVRDGAPLGTAAEHPAIDATTLSIRPDEGLHGVIGTNPGDSTVANVGVWDMQQIGDHMYIGGEFQQVQLGEDGSITNQAFLARFDIATGHFDPTFTPVLDGNVHALEVSPAGLLLVGGEFTNVNGIVNTAAIAAFDPATGALDPDFRTSMERPWSSNEPVVREIEVVGQLLYVAGNFSHLRDRETNKRERVYKLARLDADSGQADLTWRPEVTGGSIYGLAVDQVRGRVMLTGSFGSVSAVESTNKLALIDTVVGQVITDTMPDTAWKIFDIEYANDMIFLANGWNNQITVHDADTFELLHNYESDGDFQFIEKIGDYIYAGCHCTQDPDYPTARILSATTGLDLDIRFDIGGNIDGAWSVATDTHGCAWIGGDILNGGFNGSTVWARGFARFCQQ